MEIVVPPGVQALAEDSPVKDGVLAQAQALDRALGKLLFPVVELETDVVNLDRHGGWGGTSGLGDRPEADQGDVVNLNVTRGVFADLLKNAPADGLRTARGLGHPPQEPPVLTRIVKLL